MENKELNLDNIFKNNFNEQQIKIINKICYGREIHEEIELKTSSLELCEKMNLDLAGFSFYGEKEQMRFPRLVKVCLIQNSIVLPTERPIEEQREKIFEKVKSFIRIAAEEKVNIVCLQETWSMPFFLCTKEKEKWASFAESAENGPSVKFICSLAKKYNMVIVSPILENDDGLWWNTAVIIDEEGEVLGKTRKNHLPSVGSFSEISYYSPGNLGHPVFESKYGRIAVNICYGRHHALNWMMYGLNGAEIVFNPAATISEFGESFWGIEARNAAFANSYFTCSINRVGTEKFIISTDGIEKTISRTYYGSSYVTAPNGQRTPSLSRVRDGLLITEIDLNLCRQAKDKWGINMTNRLADYAKSFNEIIKK